MAGRAAREDSARSSNSAESPDATLRDGDRRAAGAVFGRLTRWAKRVVAGVWTWWVDFLHRGSCGSDYPSGPPCPKCGARLRTRRAKQCVTCGEDVGPRDPPT